jgi:hypothetical protein
VLELSTEPQRDRWFNPGLVPAAQRLRDVVAVVAHAVEHHEYKRALKPQERHTLNGVLAVLVANLVQHFLAHGPGGVVVPRSKKVLGAKPTRYEPFVYPKPFPKWLDALEVLGFIKQTKGVYAGMPGQARRGTVRAGAKLAKLLEEHKVTLDDIRDDGAAEVIILSTSKRGYWDNDPGARRKDYADTATTRRYRSELQETNAWLARADIQFDDDGYREYAEARKLKQKHVDVHQRALRRHFTLGRSEFDSGGRLFGGFWEPLPKEARMGFIRIEGEAVTGLDYSQLNPLLCYGVAKVEPPPGDAYALPGLEEYRDGVKRVFNAMLFHHPVTKFPKRTEKEIKDGVTFFPKGIKCGGVVAMILHTHPKLRVLLSGGNIGHYLQFLESQIMMRVLRCCRERNIIALPVFDCVVVKASEEAAASRIMRREFKAVAGLNITVKRELGAREKLLRLLQRHAVSLRRAAGGQE